MLPVPIYADEILLSHSKYGLCSGLQHSSAKLGTEVMGCHLGCAVSVAITHQPSSISLGLFPPLDWVPWAELLFGLPAESAFLTVSRDHNFVLRVVDMNFQT